MTEAHPLRCETCEHTKMWDDSHFDCQKHKRQLSWVEFRLICVIGCASHSSAKESSNSKAAPSHARTSDDVLRSDKVLEKTKRCEECGVAYGGYGYIKKGKTVCSCCYYRTKEREQG